MTTPDPPATVTDTTSRSELSSRVLPQMTLSSGSSDSLTAPPPPLSSSLTPSQRAAERFSVRGNAIVTGGAGTLALEASRALLEHGLQGLAILDINPSQSRAAIDSLKHDFPQATITEVEVDVTDAASVDSATETARSRLPDGGHIDILACFAGVVQCLPSRDLSPGQWRRVLDINTTGTWYCCQTCARHMVAQGTGGSILLVASISGQSVNFPQPQVAYNVSKAGVLHLKSCLAAEWARHGIRVNSISPGYMDTVLNEGDGLKDARDVWTGRNPWGRMGRPDELTGAVVLLCSRAGSYINGADLVVDGGGLVF